MSIGNEYTILDTLLGVRKELLIINKYMEEINSLIKKNIMPLAGSKEYYETDTEIITDNQNELRWD